ncbi:hypothetical protein [Zhongshania sp. BJYM1]|uniref:hypothetical protein n=1 Tax=Zhongshania aquatica TaxID=2965069 RepID=UPI0022B56A4E|nr:hypothetical protein [Marortus sp. BJYM1]
MRNAKTVLLCITQTNSTRKKLQWCTRTLQTLYLASWHARPIISVAGGIVVAACYLSLLTIAVVVITRVAQHFLRNNKTVWKSF